MFNEGLKSLRKAWNPDWNPGWNLGWNLGSNRVKLGGCLTVNVISCCIINTTVIRGGLRSGLRRFEHFYKADGTVDLDEGVEYEDAHDLVFQI